MNLSFITGNYPSPKQPASGTFVRQFVEAMAQQGHQCTVIHPWKIHHWIRECGTTKKQTRSSSLIKVYRPLLISLSNKRIANFSTFELTHQLFRHSVWRVLKRMNCKPDLLYGHFLYSAGETAVWAGRRLNRPGVAGVGEGTFWSVEPLGIERARRHYESASGAMAVSSILRDRLIDEIRIPKDRVAVFPNGVDLEKFYAQDKKSIRRKYGLPLEVFLPIYVGNFIPSKGVNRFASAVANIQSTQGIFVGKGPARPNIPNIAFCDKVDHTKVPELMSAADCFVLVSDVEGSSNATLEAMACGLPIITSNGAYMDDIVDDEVAIRVDPMDIGQIRDAIKLLKDNPNRRRRMSEACLSKSKLFDINERARRVTQWMEQIIAKHKCRFDAGFV